MARAPGDHTIFDSDLERVNANHAPLTPVTFLRRTARAYPDKVAVIHGDRRYTYGEFYERCRRLASALVKRGLGAGDCVAVMAPNTPEMLEAHFAVPMMGGVLNCLNLRLHPDTLAYILRHGEAKALITDSEFAAPMGAALAQLDRKPLVIDVCDPLGAGGARLGHIDYDGLLAEGDPEFAHGEPRDEWQSISLLYTSGTTGRPKGVLYHHRGAYLATIANICNLRITRQSVYLWTVPMFHCNGWMFPWGATAMAGTHVCLRKLEPARVFDLIPEHGITHLCGAPVVLNMLANEPRGAVRRFDWTVDCGTGGAAPPSSVIRAMEARGFRITHYYGLTETYGPATYCAPQEPWQDLPDDDRCAKMALQGVNDLTTEAVRVVDPASGRTLARNGQTLGEVMFRGNTVMKGYHKDPDATAQALAGGWLRSGDLAVWHPDGYLDVKDRAKDIIISGGENISSLEVEDVLYRHPEVLEAAVVARPDETWGEHPCAFITAQPGSAVTAEDIKVFCRRHLAGFAIPKTVIFDALPKTSTGKVQKFLLRERARSL